MLPSLLLLAAPLVAAHAGCGGHEIARRNPGGPVIHRRQVDNTNVGE